MNIYQKKAGAAILTMTKQTKLKSVIRDKDDYMMITKDSNRNRYNVQPVCI